MLVDIYRSYYDSKELCQWINENTRPRQKSICYGYIHAIIHKDIAIKQHNSPQFPLDKEAINSKITPDGDTAKQVSASDDSIMKLAMDAAKNFVRNKCRSDK